MPKKFDAKGIFGLVLQIFGVTEDNIFARLEKKIGKENADKVRIAWDGIKAYIKNGVEGLYEFAKGHVDKLRDALIQKIIDWVKEKVIKKGLTKLATIFIPFAGLIQAVKTLWDNASEQQKITYEFW